MDDFRSLFELLPIGAYRSTPEGRLLRANPELVRITGCDSEAELLAAMTSIGPDWYVEPARREQFRRVLESEGQVRGFVSEVHRYQRRERIWISENARAIRNHAGDVLHYEGTVEEITERMQWALALHRSEEHLRQIADHVPGMVYRLHVTRDGHTHYSFVGKGVQALYGVTPEQVLADPDLLRGFRHPDDRDRVESQARQAFFDGSPIATEFRVVDHEGRIKWLQMSSSVTSDDGREQVRVGVLLDVTAQREATALRTERDRAAASQQAMTRFLSRVSHELRTPLNAILGFAQLIDTDAATAAHQKPWVRELLASGQHLLTLVEDVLDLSGAQSDQMQIELTDVALGEVVAECRAMLEAAAQAQSLRWHLLPPGEAGWRVRADRKRLKQVVANLLSNAVKYNRPGGGIWIDAHRSGTDRVALRIADEGQGLSAEQLERLFLPFERLGAQHGPIEGSGLGLALSRQLALAMAGDIHADSRVGEGTAFTLELPAA